MKVFFVYFVTALYILELEGMYNDYCSWDYTFPCRSYRNKLTLCGAKKRFGPRCPKDARMVDVSADKVTEFINQKRMLVANETQISNMNRLHWCKELALIAEYSVRLCNPNSGFCPRTHRFNNARIYSREYTFSLTENIDIAAINKLWENYRHLYMNDTDKFDNNKFAEGFAHFVHFQSTHVGCAASRFTRYAEHKFLFACAFSHSPNFGKSYGDGPPASNCLSGIASIDYEGLCDVKDDDRKIVSDIC